MSPHRTQRPWQGALAPTEADKSAEYLPDCYLCPGNLRANGERNPLYESTFAFPNDFPALLPASGHQKEDDPLFQSQPASGECRVLCYSPRHDLTLAEMDVRGIEQVVSLWKEQYAELSQSYAWVQIFENKGEMMGCSNPHPHGQIWASDFLPSLPARVLQTQAEFFRKHGEPMLQRVARREIELGERVVEANASWIAIVPFWATWPFETLILPRRNVTTFNDLDPTSSGDLATLLKSLLTRYDHLFDVSFPYSMGWRPAPAGAQGWTLHAHIFPPLLRSSTVRKFLVGYEMLAEAQRDITPEQAAARLREAH